MAEKFWLIEEDKALVESVIGSSAAKYIVWLASNNILSEFTTRDKDLQVQDGLSKVIEGSDWTYAIYWQVSASKSGKSALVWGEGHFRELDSSDDKVEFHDKCENWAEGARRKLARKKIHNCFRAKEVDNIAEKLELVSDVEMFYLTSMYFAFPFDKPSTPSQAFNTSRTIWSSDAQSCLEHYQSRAFLAKSAKSNPLNVHPVSRVLQEVFGSCC